MYEQYLKYNHIPAGAILKRILDKEHISQRKLAEMSGLLPQHINAYIKGTRRFSPKTSLQLEAQLNITKPGYFFLLQSNHDIYILIQEQHANANRILKDQFRPNLFWDTSLESLDVKRDADWIIRRVFEYGDEKEIMAVIDIYGHDKTFNSLHSINDHWNEETRQKNIKQYLSNEII